MLNLFLFLAALGGLVLGLLLMSGAQGGSFYNGVNGSCVEPGFRMWNL